MRLQNLPRETLLRLKQDESGSLAPTFVLIIGAVLTLVGATLAMSMDSRAANSLQHSADGAALAGATEFVNAVSPKAEDRIDAATRAATAMAQSNTEFAIVDLNIAQVTEDAYGQHTVIDVELKFSPVNTIAKIAGRNGNIDITRRATAEATWGFPLCVLTLATSDSNVHMSGSTKLTAENCIVWSNSDARDSMHFVSGDADAKSFCTAGGVLGGNNASPSPSSQCEPIPDPLANWRAPSPGGCQDAGDLTPDTPENLEEVLELLSSAEVPLLDLTDSLSAPDRLAEANAFITAAMSERGNKFNADGTLKSGVGKGLTLNEVLQILGYIDNLDPAEYADDAYTSIVTDRLTPGTYCGLDIAYGHAEMAPGIYHIKEGPLTVRRRATLTGEGVTIILHGDDATFNVLDEARLTLEAPIDGRTAGFALVEDKTEYISGSQPLRSRLTGSGEINAIGTIYLPRQDLDVSGDGAGQQASPLLQIVANRLKMSDSGEINIDFDTSKTKVPVGIKPERRARLTK